MPRHDRVKVQAGCTASRNRVPLDFVPNLTAQQLDQRRKYAGYVRDTRRKDLDTRQRHANRQILAPVSVPLKRCV